MAIKAGTLDTPRFPKSILYVIRPYCGAVCSLCSQQYNIERWGWEGGRGVVSVSTIFVQDCSDICTL